MYNCQFNWPLNCQRSYIFYLPPTGGSTEGNIHMLPDDEIKDGIFTNFCVFAHIQVSCNSNIYLLLMILLVLLLPRLIACVRPRIKPRKFCTFYHTSISNGRKIILPRSSQITLHTMNQINKSNKMWQDNIFFQFCQR